MLQRLSVYQLRQWHRTFMTSFHQFNILAASRNEGLHPKLRALLERAAVSPFSEVSMRKDGLIQAGPSPDSEAVGSRGNVTPFSREPARAVVATSKPEPQRLSAASPKRDRIA
jgi:hypothetical protein